MRRGTRLVASAMLMGAFLISAALAWSPAVEAASYRYWSYWLGSATGWSYSSWGPASLQPADGSVEGWRFGVGEGTNGAGLAPRSIADFDRICAGTEATADAKRVAIIIDPGLPEHAPPGETPRGTWAMCVRAPHSATGFDILRAAASVRTQSGMVCGLAGYPATECAVVVTPPRPSAQPAPAPEREAAREPEPEAQSTTRPIPPSEPERPHRDPGPTAGPPTGEDDDGTDEHDQMGTGNDDASLSVNPSPASANENRSSDRDAKTSTTRSDLQTTSASTRTRTSPMTHPGDSSQPMAAQPNITIVSTAVTDPTAGPGPLAAIFGAAAMAVLAVIAYLRRRTPRSTAAPDA